MRFRQRPEAVSEDFGPEVQPQTIDDTSTEVAVPGLAPGTIHIDEATGRPIQIQADGSARMLNAEETDYLLSHYTDQNSDQSSAPIDYSVQQPADPYGQQDRLLPDGRVERRIEIFIEAGYRALPQDQLAAGTMLGNALSGIASGQQFDGTYSGPPAYSPQPLAGPDYQPTYAQPAGMYAADTAPRSEPVYRSSSDDQTPKRAAKPEAPKKHRMRKFGKAVSYLAVGSVISWYGQSVVVEPAETAAFQKMSGDKTVSSYWSEAGVQGTDDILFVGKWLSDKLIPNTNRK